MEKSNESFSNSLEGLEIMGSDKVLMNYPEHQVVNGNKAFGLAKFNSARNKFLCAVLFFEPVFDLFHFVK